MLGTKQGGMLLIKKISDNRYYKYMQKSFADVIEDGSGDVNKMFTSVHRMWFDCFSHVMRKWDPECTPRTIRIWFYDFPMQHGDMFWLENHPTYFDYTRQQLLDTFASECHYYSDRMSPDKLICLHWLFWRIFEDEMSSIQN